MALLFKKILISIIVLVLAGLSLGYGIARRQAYVTHLKLTETRNALNFAYPAVERYNLGLISWVKNQPAEAINHFRSAIEKNTMFADAWIKLAEAYIVTGNRQAALDILAFLNKLTLNSFYRKWEQTLLAFDLKDGATLIRNANFFLSHQKMINECLYILDQYFEKETLRLADQIEPANRKAFFNWLLRWRRMDDCAAVWPMLTPEAREDEKLRVDYSHWLIQNKDIIQALEINKGKWYSESLFNGSFESEPLKKAYGWRFWKGHDDDWQIKRIEHDKIDGYYALQINFKGTSNLSFHHLLQIVPVVPKTTYRLTYWWKSDTLTTDQRPYIDIAGFDTKGFYTKGPMVAPDQSWSKTEIRFQTPEQGQAILVRLRRIPSKRIDNKLRGRLLLDHFQLQRFDDA